MAQTIADTTTAVVTSDRAFTVPSSERAGVMGRTLGFLFSGVQHKLTSILLDDREQACVEESDLEEHEERQRAVDAVCERVEHGRGEVETERELDHRLDDEALPVFLADPLVGLRFDAVLRRARELGLLVEQRLEDRLRVVDGEAD